MGCSLDFDIYVPERRTCEGVIVVRVRDARARSENYVDEQAHSSEGSSSDGNGDVEFIPDSDDDDDDDVSCRIITCFHCE